MHARFFIVLLAFAVVSCSETDGGKTIIRLAHNGSELHPFQNGFDSFAQTLEEQTDGQVVIKIFPSSQLGSEEEAIEMVKLGVISGTAASAAGLGSFVSEVDVLNLPFIFRDLEHFYAVLDGPVGKRIGEKIESKLDCIVLGWWFSGIRNVWNKKREVNVPSDLEGLKIRVIGSPIVLDAFNALGAQATNMSFGELYSAIQQGVLDGAESDHTDLLVEKFYEVTKYVSMTEHLYLAAPFLYSKKKFDELTPETQTAVLAAGRASVEVQRRAMEAMNDEARTKLEEDLGLVFNEVDGEAFRKKILDEDVYKRNADRVGGMDIINEVINR